MLKDSSATVREQSPHVNQTSNPATNTNALKRRAQAIVNDKSIDADSRKIISYALLINDPWLPELVRSVDAGENITESFDYSQATAAVEDTSSEENIEALAEIICRANDRSAAALAVLMRTLEKSTHVKLLANKAKHLAFNRCAESNLLGMVDTQIALIEGELSAGDRLMS